MPDKNKFDFRKIGNTCEIANKKISMLTTIISARKQHSVQEDNYINFPKHIVLPVFYLKPMKCKHIVFVV